MQSRQIYCVRFSPMPATRNWSVMKPLEIVARFHSTGCGFTGGDESNEMHSLLLRCTGYGGVRFFRATANPPTLLKNPRKGHPENPHRALLARRPRGGRNCLLGFPKGVPLQPS